MVVDFCPHCQLLVIAKNIHILVHPVGKIVLRPVAPSLWSASLTLRHLGTWHSIVIPTSHIDSAGLISNPIFSHPFVSCSTISPVASIHRAAGYQNLRGN